MLIQFKVSNFRSIKETQTLSLVANADKELPSNLIETGNPSVPKLLRSAAIYGPNAAGKSNFMHALAFMESMVRESARAAQVGEEISGVASFRLDSAFVDKDSEFEVHFIAENIRYQYGFCVNKTRVTNEWLYAYPNNVAQRWFERAYDSDNDTYHYKFSDYFDEGKARHDRANYTIPNNLYLSVAVQKNSQQLLPVFNWFQKNLQYILSMGSLKDRKSRTSRICLEDTKKLDVLNFMNAAGIAVNDLSVKKESFSIEHLPIELDPELRERIVQGLQGQITYETDFIYNDINDQPVHFDLNEESDGTQTLYAFASGWLKMLENDEVMFIDEIDTSLHPLIVHHLVKLLHQNKSNSQLIFTTHDTSLLAKRDLMRRDQIWFVERSKQNTTELYSLSDYSPRKNEAIEKGYLSGRYGGIPFLSELDSYGE